ncbi:hypothetical protein RchiOBHm_Chr4g0391441 [Rosa chinensis]|uniref:Secreted protein n=1 Tax=Rosa chinensis TaxID=74649 RepID=A0A2P6QQH9_ROSCH|nr:hypothetical protein RchiOBHm_Chr4g0391441 [Rosa chinensis]
MTSLSSNNAALTMLFLWLRLSVSASKALVRSSPVFNCSNWPLKSSANSAWFIRAVNTCSVRVLTIASTTNDIAIMCA